MARSLNPYRPKKILVNASDPILSETIPYLLSQEGYEAILVANGKEAIHQLQQAEFDLIITSSHSKLFSGMELIAFVRETLQVSTPVVVLSEIPSHSTEFFEHYEVQLVLERSFDLDELFESVHQIITQTDELLAAS